MRNIHSTLFVSETIKKEKHAKLCAYHPGYGSEGNEVPRHEILRVEDNLGQLQKQECHRCRFSNACRDCVPSLVIAGRQSLLVPSLEEELNMVPLVAHKLVNPDICKARGKKS